VSLKAPLKFVIARNQIPKLHRFGFRHDTAIAETRVVRQELSTRCSITDAGTPES
jgi:hypothetical protein